MRKWLVCHGKQYICLLVRRQNWWVISPFFSIMNTIFLISTNETSVQLLFIISSETNMQRRKINNNYKPYFLVSI